MFSIQVLRMLVYTAQKIKIAVMVSFCLSVTVHKLRLWTIYEKAFLVNISSIIYRGIYSAFQSSPPPLQEIIFPQHLGTRRRGGGMDEKILSFQL